MSLLPNTKLPTQRQLRVLVVEDDPDTATTTAALVRHWGFDVRIANDGEAALDQAEQAFPDVALLDIALPGIDGFEVARRLRARQGERRPLLIAVTGFCLPEDESMSSAVGIDLHWHKPLIPENLLRVLTWFTRLNEPGDLTAEG